MTVVPSVLVFATVVDDRARAYASAHPDVRVVFVTDARLAPGDHSVLAVPYDDLDGTVEAVRQRLSDTPVGVLALDDLSALPAAIVAAALDLPWHRPAGARASVDRLEARGRWLAAGLPMPWFTVLDPGQALEELASRLHLPCEVRPALRVGERRAVARDWTALASAVDDLRTFLRADRLAHLRPAGVERVLLEGMVPGRTHALEGVMDRGALHVLAIFDVLDVLAAGDDEPAAAQVVVTPPKLSDAMQRLIGGMVAHAALASGLWHGPVHAGCRVNEDGVFVLDVAARPIGGLGSLALRFVSPAGETVSHEALLLRHAAGGKLDGYARERAAAGVLELRGSAAAASWSHEMVDRVRRIPGIEVVVPDGSAGDTTDWDPNGPGAPIVVGARADLPEQVLASLRDAARAAAPAGESSPPA